MKIISHNTKVNSLKLLGIRVSTYFIITIFLFFSANVSFCNYGLPKTITDCEQLSKFGTMVLDSSFFYVDGVPERIEELVEENKTCHSYAYVLTISGFHKFVDGDIFGSRITLLKADSIYNRNEKIDKRYQIRNNIFLGLSYNLDGDFMRAMRSFRIAESMAIKSRDNSLLSDAQLNIGSLYMQNDKIDEAVKYLMSAIKLSKKIGNREIYAFSALNLSHVFRKQEKYQEALSNAMIAEEQFKIIKDGRQQYLVEIAKAEICIKIGDSEKAIHCFEKAHRIGHQTNNKFQNGSIFFGLAELFEEFDLEKSIEYYERAFRNQNSLNEIHVKQVTNKLTDHYLKTKDVDKFNEIFNDLSKHYELKKSLLELEFNESARRELSMQKEKAKNEMLRKENEANFQMLVLIILASLLFLSMAFYVYNQLIKNRKLNEEISVKKNQLEKQNLELRNFAYVASHDLKAPANSIAGFIALLKTNIKDFADQETIQIADIIENSAKDMSKLVSSLLEFSNVKNSKFTFTSFSINELFDQIQNNLFSIIDQNNAQINFSSKLPLQIVGDEIKLKTAFQNIINNAIKFVPKNRHPIIEIGYSQNSGNHIFTFKDNGIGIEEKNIEKIFLMFQRLNNGNDYAGSGIGLSTCKKIIDLHNGAIKIESKVGEGSVFHIYIPMHLKESKPKNPIVKLEGTALRSTLN